MRPLRLHLDGFGSYRQPTDVDLSDVGFFALIGPTGAGKSTVIDALCFALYGTVPRWGKENAIAHALAPATNACRVCLVFEAAGTRYAAIRALTRDRKGQVHTKEARLERLSPTVPAAAPLDDILAASVEQLAEGPDGVKACVADILGLTYEHFTQSVLLPQGRFAEFLHARAAQRQDLLVELLAFGVYAKVGQQARERARLAAERRRMAQQERDTLTDATEEAETQAAARVAELTRLTDDVEERLTTLTRLAEEADRAEQEAATVRDEAARLAEVRIPAEVPSLAQRIADADRLVHEHRRQRDEAQHAEAAARRARDALPDKTQMEMLRTAHRERHQLLDLLATRQRELTDRQAEQRAREAELTEAEHTLAAARDALARAERAHAAIALASHLKVGENCPVCRQPVTALPHHPTPADLDAAQTAAAAADDDLRRKRDACTAAAQATASAASRVTDVQQQLDAVTGTLAEAPGEAEVDAVLTAITEADATLRRAHEHAAACQTDLSTAEATRAALTEEEKRAWAYLRTIRDSVVAFGAPPVTDGDLAAAWGTLTAWAKQQRAERERREPDLDEAARRLRRQHNDAVHALTGLLTEHGVTAATDPARIPTVLAEHRVRAENDLDAIRAKRRRAADLDRKIAAHREEEEVTDMLGRLLQSNAFERWLCGEALDALVAEASVTLLELSEGQYELDRDDRNDLMVIDHSDAGTRRPVHTLSGGETFQASLALALALSRQVVGLSAGMRDLNSMFLDEGFGTLDGETLETVAATLERLAADSDRMVGIITHVPALAERVPVRFVVTRTGATSTLRKERL